MPILRGIPELKPALSGTVSAADALAVLIPREAISLGELCMKALRARSEPLSMLVDSHAGRVVITNVVDVNADFEGYSVPNDGELVITPETTNFLSRWVVVSNTTFPIDVTQIFNPLNRLTLARIVDVLASHAAKPFILINQTTGLVTCRVVSNPAELSDYFLVYNYQEAFTCAFDIKPKVVVKRTFE